jgi:hypothetical protein
MTADEQVAAVAALVAAALRTDSWTATEEAEAE